jgi:hypothetical protein
MMTKNLLHSFLAARVLGIIRPDVMEILERLAELPFKEGTTNDDVVREAAAIEKAFPDPVFLSIENEDGWSVDDELFTHLFGSVTDSDDLVALVTERLLHSTEGVIVSHKLTMDISFDWKIQEALTEMRDCQVVILDYVVHGPGGGNPCITFGGTKGGLLAFTHEMSQEYKDSIQEI